MRNNLSWRVDWMLAALAVVFFGLAKSVLPYYARLSQLSEGFEAREGSDNDTGVSVLLVLSVLLALAFLARIFYRFFRR